MPTFVDQFTDTRRYSWASMLHALRHEPIPAHWGEYTASDRTTGAHGRYGWAYGLDYPGMLDLVSGKTAWADGQTSIEQQAREQAGKHVLKRPLYELGYDVTGADYDMAAVLEGRPECWLMPQVSNVGEPGLIRLVIDLATSGGVSANVICERMTAIAACALTLEASGAPVEVLAISHAHSPSEQVGYYVEVRINNAGEPIDTQRIVALAHPAFYRRGVFRLLELTPSESVAQRFSLGYGSIAPLSESIIKEVYGERTVYIPPCGLSTGAAPTCEALLKLVKARVGMKGTDDYVESE